jgi:hypothetical protein
MWTPECVALPAGYTADDVREIAKVHVGSSNKMMAIYTDGKLSIGGTTTLNESGALTVSLVRPGAGASLLPFEVNPTQIRGFGMRGRDALFFLGLGRDEYNGGDEYAYIKITDFQSRLPAEYQ